jgi:hypothetical protein
MIKNNNILNSIDQNIYYDYFPFMLQRSWVVYFIMFSPWCPQIHEIVHYSNVWQLSNLFFKCLTLNIHIIFHKSIGSMTINLMIWLVILDDI